MKDKRTTMDVSTAAPVWEELYQRLEAARLALEHGFTPSLAIQRQILRQRAQALAHVPTPEVPLPETFDVVEFLLAEERYGIASAYVREVYPLQNYTPLPCTPPFVFGLINVHGQILSVLDLKKFFDLPARDVTDLNRVIVAYHDQMEFGILADALVGVRTISRQGIQPALSTLTAAGATYIQGMTEDRVVVLDAQRLLSDKNIIVHEEVEL